MKTTIAIDFDGVIHQYTSPWSHVLEISDPPVDGAFEFIRGALREGFDVVIFTARANADPNAKWFNNNPKHDPSGVDKNIREWMVRHGLEQEIADKIEITAIKPSAAVYIDDRGWRFEGQFPSFDTIRNLKQWNRRAT